MVQRPVIMVIHTVPKLLVLWFAVEPSNKQPQALGIKYINEGIDAVLHDSLVFCKGEKPARWEEPWSQATNLCNILMGVVTCFLKGLRKTAGNSWLHYDAVLRPSVYH